MIVTALEVLAGLALLYAGGEALVRGGAALAAGFGVSRLAIGLTVVAFGTSAPELVVSLDAVLEGADGLSIGNVVGSNIANIALILGIAVLVRPAAITADVVRIHSPIVIAASLGLVAILSSGHVSRLEGVALLLGLIAYTTLTFREARRQTGAARGLEPAATEAPRRWWWDAARVMGGLGLLVVGGHLLVGAAVVLATDLGVSQATIGLTIVAVGTSLPEFAASVVAARRGEGDIAVGNVLGSNLFNILGIVGVSATIHPLTPGGLHASDLWVMVGVALLLGVFMATRYRLGRVEGAMLLSCYVGYVAWLIR